MAVNKFTFNINTKDPTIQLGFGTTFDEAGREDLIKVYEDDVVRQLVNPTKDFEVTTPKKVQTYFISLIFLIVLTLPGPTHSQQ